MPARVFIGPLLLLLASAGATGQTVVFDGQTFVSNGSIGFSPPLTIWDDLQTEFSSLTTAGTLSEISIIANKAGGPTQEASGFIDIRLFDQVSNDPRGPPIALLPFDETFFAPPDDPFNSRTLIKLDELEPLGIAIPRDAKLGVGVFFDDDGWTTALSDDPIIGSSPGDNWLGGFPDERADGGIGDFAWKVTVSETAPTASWIPFAGGSWDDPSGWDTGFVPQVNQDVDALLLTDSFGPLEGPGTNTTVKSIDFRSFASDSTFRMQPGVELTATERAVFQGRGMLEVNGGTLRTADYFGTISEFDSGLIEVTGGDFQPQRGDFLLSGSGNPTIELRDSRFLVETFSAPFEILPAELRIGDEEGHRGTIVATNGTTLSALRASIGWRIRSSGRLHLAGSGTIAEILQDLTLGDSSLSDGELVVEDGAVLNAERLEVGRFGVGHATVSAGTINVTENPLDNDSGMIELSGSPAPGLSESRLTIEAGGVVNTDFSVAIAPLGSGSGASVLVTGSGSELNTGAGVGVGANRMGSLRVLDGARLTSSGTIGTGLAASLPLGQSNSILISGPTTTADVGAFSISARGALRIDAGAQVVAGAMTAAGEVVVTGTGTLLDASVTASPFANLFAGSGVLRIEDGAEVRSAGLSVGNFNGTGSLAIVTGAGARLQSEGPFFFVGDLSDGTLEVRDGGRVHQTGDVILNASDTAEGTLVVAGGGAHFDVDGSIYISGGRVEDQVLDAQTPAIVRVEHGGAVSATGVVEPFTNGVLRLDGGTLAADEITLASGGAFDFVSGRLSVNTFTGDLANDGLGVVVPGASPGLTTVSGAYLQGPQATLEIELVTGGPFSAPGVDFDQLTADTAQIGGALSLIAPNPDGLAVGDTFLVVDTAGGRSGTFDQIEGRFLGFGLASRVDYDDPNRVIVEVVRATDLLPGDFSGDGVVDATDYAVWRESQGQTGADLIADANNNGEVDAGDRAIWAANLGAVYSPFGDPLPGDFNGDGVVDALDYAVWREGNASGGSQAGYDLWTANYGRPDAVEIPGDYNGDGAVNAADYTLWREGGASGGSQAGFDLWTANYGKSVATAIPEQGASAIAAVALLVGLLRSRH